MSGNQKQQNTSHQNPATVKTRKTEPKAVRNIDPAQMITAPETLRSEDVLAAQQQVGNQVVQRALDKKGRDQRVTDSQGNLSEDLTKQIQAKRGGGSPLPDAVQKDASKKLGRKFNDVRIHTDETANKLSRSVSARAFTIGKDIFFKGGVFSPSTSAGRETLIHELTHVVQQSSGKASSGGKIKLGAPDTAMEKEAAHIGKKHATQIGASAPVAGAIQRQSGLEEEEMMQGQPDTTAAIQRQSGLEEEELMQGQPDNTAVIQRVQEEEEMQMQTDTAAVIQRDDMPEEELMTQPDASTPVIQRDMKSDLAEEMEKRKKKAANAPIVAAKKNLKSLKGPKAPALKTPPPIPTAAKDPLQEVKKQIAKNKSQTKADSLLGGKPAVVKKVEKPKKLTPAEKKAQKVETKLAKANAKEDAKAYTGSRLKDPIAGDAKADPAKEEKTESKSGKVGGFFKSAGNKALGGAKFMGKKAWSGTKYLGGKAQQYASKKGDEVFSNFLGVKPNEKKEEKKEEATPAPMTVNNYAGGGGSAGAGAAGGGEIEALKTKVEILEGKVNSLSPQPEKENG